MRLPRFRFTVRRMMVAVAVVGTAIGATVAIGRQRAYYLERAAFYRHEGEPHFTFTPDGLTDEQMRKAFAGLRADAAKIRMLPIFKINREQAAMYERAARLSWLPVEPDPPMPK